MPERILIPPPPERPNGYAASCECWQCSDYRIRCAGRDALLAAQAQANDDARAQVISLLFDDHGSTGTESTNVPNDDDIPRCASCDRSGVYLHWSPFGRECFACHEANYCSRCNARLDEPVVGGGQCFACEETSWCEDCNEYPAEGDSDLCAYCSVNNPNPSPGDILFYSYRPLRFKFHGDGPTFLGMELEVESTSGLLGQGRSIVADRLGNLGYMKQDGSLDHGFEIVTHPMDYPWALDNFPWEMLTELSRAGFVANDNCGLHVHVSRDAFDGPGHAYRWMKFIHRNQHAVESVARREGNSYCAFDSEFRASVKHFAKGSRRWMERYSAINVQNVDTFEVRVFASSLVPREVKAALAMVDASVEYTRTLTVADLVWQDGWRFRPFTRWLRDRKPYAPLWAEIQRRVPAYVLAS